MLGGTLAALNSINRVSGWHMTVWSKHGEGEGEGEAKGGSVKLGVKLGDSPPMSFVHRIQLSGKMGVVTRRVGVAR